MIRRWPALLAAVGALVTAFPDVAVAHGIGGRLDLPVPVSFFVAGAGLVLVVSFVALALLWPVPRLQDGPRFEGSGRAMKGGWLLRLLGVAGLLLVIGQVIPPLVGADTLSARPTIAPVLVWVAFWLVVPFAGAVIGNWYTFINPWRSLGSLMRIGRVERTDQPATWGVWPATIVFLAFTWLELVSPNSGSPRTLGTAALAYTVGMIWAMAFIGRDTGLAMFDAFTPYNRLISAIAPFGRDDGGRIRWRGWLRALPAVPEWPGLAAFVVVAIGTVTYDGASATTSFRELFGGFARSISGASTLLLATVAVVGLGYLLACWAASRLAGGRIPTLGVARRFAHTLVPIALAYAVAHYLTLIIFEGQQLISAMSDPFALGWDLFGAADRRVDFFITASEPIWYAQVAVIVVGHVLGVVLAHDRALADFGPDAVRSQYAMLVLMVALTMVGLLVLSG